MAAEQNCSWEQATKGVDLSTGMRHRIVVPAPDLIVRFEMAPNNSATLEQERYTLMGGTTKDEPRYRQTKSASDDLIKGDAYIDVKFTKLIPKLSYWLEVDPGGGKAKYMAFEALPWEKIAP